MSDRELRDLLERVHADNQALRKQVSELLERVSMLERALTVTSEEKERLARAILHDQLNPHGQSSTFTPAEAKELVAFLKGDSPRRK